MDNKYRLCYFKFGTESLKEKDYHDFLEAKTNIPCTFNFKANGIHNNMEHYQLQEIEINSQNKETKIIQTYVYVNNDK